MKLLDRTVKNYLIYSTLLVLLFTPLFYFTIEQLFAHEMDEELMEHKKDFIKSLDYIKSADDLNLFHLMNKEFQLVPVKVLPAGDSLYSQDLFDSTEMESVPHRILKTGIAVEGQFYELIIMESIVSNSKLIGTIMGTQVAMLVMLLGGSILINRKLSKSIWNPFHSILERLKKYNIDQDPALSLPHSSITEFRELIKVINQLVKKIHEAYLNQREFTENASHEMQTPLAICRTKLELLAQTKELTEEQAELVEGLLESTDRLTRLNKNLLLLSKIENRQFLETEEVDLEASVLKCLHGYADAAQRKHLDIHINFTGKSFVRVNPALLEILINNMLSNAIRYSPENGKIEIQGAKRYMIVTNTGERLEHPEKIFQRFHRESRMSAGSGLGLSIVKKICDVNGFHITYEYNPPNHQFKILFS